MKYFISILFIIANLLFSQNNYTLVGGITISKNNYHDNYVEKLGDVIPKFDVNLGYEYKIEFISIGTGIFHTGSIYKLNTIENQSEMTARLVESILKNGKCELSSFEVASQLHQIFLQSMLEHWNKAQNNNDSTFPIT